jgi:hypothetical protein
VIRSPFEQDADELRREALKRAGQPLTPQHAACEAVVDSQDGSTGRLRRVRTADDDPAVEAQEEAGRGPGIREGAVEVPKAFRDAHQPPADYPHPVAVRPEDFRRGPITAGHDALSPGYGPPLSFPAPPALSRLMPDPGGECA